MCFKKLLKEIKEDCLDLKNKGLLTEFGEGQLALIEIIEKKNKIY